ncbi:MAG: alanine--tRNA ligase [Gemmatimonadetes bacterium]|jgi:alanyl-tRNA synthetase|nr:alanine--tRNA ligase [Gemmatimonadota bacterium]MBT4612205.1 alanine--tRNA ligase [Gemmatimonadota bacterium]MBT5060571.1 alanine--tRNA ligase [Gemmatimonadota bacterium]MBT5146262.1 alanine--tRNA ligase [Gemmatimonadota bacterium]MBT5588972.1 alanine--tRNA ligase [Gemmatimonadota bacterium]
MSEDRVTSHELREKFITFFEGRGHSRIGATSMVPEHDPSALFISAGMQPLVPYLLGQPHPAGTRLVNTQRCFRTTDIELVGNSTHLTLVEMLGNWSLGDYGREDMIPWSWTFLTHEQWLGIDPLRLFVTVFSGDGEVPADRDSSRLWQEQFRTAGIDALEGQRIFPLGREDNWWGPVGRTGPCGPDSEMFYDTVLAPCSSGCRPGCGCGKYVEIWNDVFMEYERREDGSTVPLQASNIDTGMGLIRTLAALNGLKSIYETDVLRPVGKAVREACGQELPTGEASDGELLVSQRIVTDHVVSAVHLIADGVQPSNVEQGYVLRRLIRRALMHLRKLGARESVWDDLVVSVRQGFGGAYPTIDESPADIVEVLSAETEQFSRTLDTGLRRLRQVLQSDSVTASGQLGGDVAFDLFATFGFPLEMTRDLAVESGVTVDEKGFDEHFARHQELSRQGGQQRFAGGLADHSESTTRYHTATHLLHAALREILGDHVVQRGSNVTPERLRFDFLHPAKVGAEELEQVERLVNGAIEGDYPVVWAEMAPEEAMATGSLGLFQERYGERVRVYAVGDLQGHPRAREDAATFSKEICGGPHVDRTGELGRFRIVKEQSASSGVRRIRAVLE